jgi:hypothetical protein
MKPADLNSIVATVAAYLGALFALGSVFYLTNKGAITPGEYLTLVGPLLGAGGVHAINLSKRTSPKSPVSQSEGSNP